MEGIGKVEVGVVFEASDLLEFLADIRNDVLGNVNVLVDTAVVATNTEERRSCLWGDDDRRRARRSAEFEEVSAETSKLDLCVAGLEWIERPCAGGKALRHIRMPFRLNFGFVDARPFVHERDEDASGEIGFEELDDRESGGKGGLNMFIQHCEILVDEFTFGRSEHFFEGVEQADVGRFKFLRRDFEVRCAPRWQEIAFLRGLGVFGGRIVHLPHHHEGRRQCCNSTVWLRMGL